MTSPVIIGIPIIFLYICSTALLGRRRGELARDLLHAAVKYVNFPQHRPNPKAKIQGF